MHSASELPTTSARWIVCLSVPSVRLTANTLPAGNIGEPPESVIESERGGLGNAGKLCGGWLYRVRRTNIVRLLYFASV